MRVLNRLDISGSFGLGSTSQDQFVIGSPDVENNDVSTDNLKVWANSDFKNNVTLGSNNADIISVSGTLVNFGGASLTGSFSGSGANLNNLTASNISNFNTDVGGVFLAGTNVTINQVGNQYAISSSAAGPGGTIYTEGNITGSGEISNKIRTKDDVTFTTVTASYYTGSGANLDYVDFAPLTTAPTQDRGIVWQDSASYELRQWTEVPNVHIKLGQQVVTRAHNNTGVTIPKGTVVHLTGSNNQPVPRIIAADWTSDYLSANTLGITNNDILQGGEGYVVISGLVEGIDTNGFNSGDILYLSGSGGLSNVKAVAPNHLVIVGQVIRNGNSSVGSVFVKIQNGYEIGELHDVIDSSPQNYDLLVRDTDGLWKNTKTLAGDYTFSGNNQITGNINGTASYASDSDLLDGKDSLQYALKTDVTGAIADFPVRSEVSGAITGALTPYALSSDVSSSFGLKTDLTASYAQLSVNNIFTGVNTLGAFTGSSAFISGDVRINGTASVGLLETVNQTSLQIGDKYIIILSGAVDHPTLDGSGLLWGSGAVGDPTQGPLGEMAYIRYYAANDQLEIFPGLKVSGSLTASNGYSGRLFDTASYALDADTVDGLHASSFAQKNTAVTFTEVTASTGFSGGTFSGTTISASDGLTGSNLHIRNVAEFDGGVKINYSAKTNNYTLTASSDYVISFSGSLLTGTLPNAANILGTVLVIKNLHTSSVFVTSSTARIDGSTTGVYINGRYTSYTFLSDNTDWLII